MGKPVELSGLKFGDLTVLGASKDTYIDPKRGYKYKKWDCRCEICGNIISVRTSNLTRKDGGGTRSCGCQRLKHMKEVSTTHGDSGTRLYKIWKGIKKRCYNEKCISYKDYGERGIKMCDEWRDDYVAFKAWSLANGYNNDLSIDRIDYNGDYCPENCRWTTTLVQANNSRHCRYITYNGKTHSISEWAKLLGVPKSTLYTRIITRNWSIEDTFSIPVREHIAGQRLKNNEGCKIYGTGT